MIDTTKFEITGYRFISRDYSEKPEIGEILETSYVWDGDEATEDELNGTCVFESLELCEEYSKYSKGWIAKVGGMLNGYGDLFGEILIGDCEVISITNRNI